MTTPTSSLALARVAITGATGLLGSALGDALRADGCTVFRLVRRPSGEDTDIIWDPARGHLDPATLEGMDAIVHLAGESLAHRWTPERKRRIRHSRVHGTTLLARTIASLQRKPRAFLSGSAVGIYGSHREQPLDEGSPPGGDFLARVALEWEGATAAAREAGVRVVCLRTGVVLTPSGGMLERLLPPFRLGLGGRIGSGARWLSWIDLDDWVRAVRYLMTTETIHGPVNLVSPSPATNEQFTRALGRALHRPTLAVVPAFALELLFGEMARETILADQRVCPRVLEDGGFRFAHPTLEEALTHALGAR